MKTTESGLQRTVLFILRSKFKSPETGMIIRLGRLTPGYFRLLQRQMSGEVRLQPHGSLLEPIAMTMAAVGTAVSLYSTRQMAANCTKEH